MNLGDRDPGQQSRKSFITQGVCGGPLVLSLRADLAIGSVGTQTREGHNGVGNGKDPKPPDTARE